MPTIAPVTTGGMYTGSTAAAAPKAELDKEAFLQLLVTQLRNQDPSAPMDSNALMAQTTQMATVEQMTELATTQRESFGLQMRVSAAAFIGQTASYADAAGVTQTGEVTSVSFAGSVPTVHIGDADIALGSISALTTKTSASTSV
jgi:flagellar basal-body rod modification protein FlgD